MEQDEEFNEVIEAFHGLRFGEGFLNSDFVMECYDAGFSLGQIDEAVLEDLQSCSIDALYNVVEKLHHALEKPTADNGGNNRQNLLVALEHAKIPVREILVAVAVFLHLGVKAKRNGGVAVRGALAGAFYILLLAATKGQIPAALHKELMISKLYLLSLFSKSADMLCVPGGWKTAVPVKKGRGRQVVLEEPDAEEDQMEVTMAYNVMWPDAELMLLKAWAVYLQSVDLASAPFHMGRLARSLATVWVQELPGEEFVLNPRPPINTRRLVASHCFSLLVSVQLKRDIRETNLRMVLFGLLPGLLCLADDLTSYKPTIPRNVDAFSKRVTKFICEIMAPFLENDGYDQTFLGFMQNMFANVPDSQSYRQPCASTFVRFLDALNFNLRIEVVQWVVMESEAERIRNRKFALEVISAIFLKDWQNFDIPYAQTATVEAIVWKVCCDRLKDKSAQVRKIAASVLQSLPLEKNGVKWMERLHTAQQDEGSFRKVFDTILDGCSDVFATPRRTCIQLLGKLLRADTGDHLFSERVREVILRAAQDPAKLVRQANMEVVASLRHIDQNVFADLWIKCVFNQYMDAEKSIRDATVRSFLAVIMEEIVQPMDSKSWKNVMAWNVLGRICKDEVGNLRLLRQMLCDMKKDADAVGFDAINKNTIKYIKANVLTKDGTDKTVRATAWKFVAELSRLIKDDRNVDFALDFLKTEADVAEEDMACASAFQIVHFNLSVSKPADLQRYGQHLLSIFPRTRGVASIVEAVRCIHSYYELCDDSTEFTPWSNNQLLEATDRLDETLQRLTDLDDPDKDAGAAFDVRLIGEIALHAGLYQKGQTATRFAEHDPLKLIVRMCDFGGPRSRYRPWIRAHAVFALGRLCLGTKTIAWNNIAAIVDVANGLNIDNGLRRDAIVVVFDILRMFGDVVETHLGKVYGWLSDPCIEIRGDVINHIQTLLLNEHLQWNPTVFYQFLTSTCDPDESIRDSVRTCLRSLIKKRNNCYTDFAEAVVFLPRCITHPRFKAAQVADRNHAKFPLVGRQNTEKRVEIYAFMLKQMNDQQKRLTVHRILEQILVPVVTKEVDIARPANSAYRDVLMDVMKILGLKEMEFSAFLEEEDEDEIDDENENEDAREDAAQRQGKKMSKEEMKQIWNKFRKELIQRHLIPVLAAVYRQLRELTNDPELFNACVSLVDHMAQISDIDLEELARQTGGTEGLIFKALVIDIKLHRCKEAPASGESGRTDAVLSEPDDIPWCRETPNEQLEERPERSVTVEPVLSVTVEPEPKPQKRKPKPGSARAISTPMVNRTRGALNLTFGSDISQITEDRTMVQRGSRK